MEQVHANASPPTFLARVCQSMPELLGHVTAATDSHGVPTPSYYPNRILCAPIMPLEDWAQSKEPSGNIKEFWRIPYSLLSKEKNLSKVVDSCYSFLEDGLARIKNASPEGAYFILLFFMQMVLDYESRHPESFNSLKASVKAKRLHILRTGLNKLNGWETIKDDKHRALLDRHLMLHDQFFKLDPQPRPQYAPLFMWLQKDVFWDDDLFLSLEDFDRINIGSLPMEFYNSILLRIQSLLPSDKASQENVCNYVFFREGVLETLVPELRASTTHSDVNNSLDVSLQDRSLSGLLRYHPKRFLEAFLEKIKEGENFSFSIRSPSIVFLIKKEMLLCFDLIKKENLSNEKRTELILTLLRAYMASSIKPFVPDTDSKEIFPFLNFEEALDKVKDEISEFPEMPLSLKKLEQNKKSELFIATNKANLLISSAIPYYYEGQSWKKQCELLLFNLKRFFPKNVSASEQHLFWVHCCYFLDCAAVKMENVQMGETMTAGAVAFKKLSETIKKNHGIHEEACPRRLPSESQSSMAQAQATAPNTRVENDHPMVSPGLSSTPRDDSEDWEIDPPSLPENLTSPQDHPMKLRSRSPSKDHGTQASPMHLSKVADLGCYTISLAMSAAVTAWLFHRFSQCAWWAPYPSPWFGLELLAGLVCLIGITLVSHYALSKAATSLPSLNVKHEH